MEYRQNIFRLNMRRKGWWPFRLQLYVEEVLTESVLPGAFTQWTELGAEDTFVPRTDLRG